MTDRYSRSNQLIEEVLNYIPLGSQTFSKSITQYPQGVSPLFIQRGLGSHVWDIDGNKYIDFVSALLSVSIGYADPDVNAAVSSQLSNGVSFSLPHPLEMEVAKALVELVPCAEMVRFGKNGTDATSAAIRLARAFTGKEHVLVCGYHGWQDWYIGSTSRDLGVPEGVKALTHSFEYNNLASVEAQFEQLGNEVAAIILEPMNVEWPQPGFLAELKSLAHKSGALLIFDETITGCRFAKGGAQELFEVTPDLATFGKGLANGLPLSVVLGRRDIMQKMEDIFFSGTFGGETLSLAAAKVVLEKVKDTDLIENLKEKGEYLMAGVSACIKRNGLDSVFKLSGHPSWSILSTNNAENYSNYELTTLLLQETFRRGILCLGSHNLSYAHSIADIDALLHTYDEVLPIISDAINQQDLLERLETDVLKPLFKVR
ncbi:MAG: aminotransferase class III-fold pyridoxal phosphate-dependent enzyme [Pseudomonadales bacterium]